MARSARSLWTAKLLGGALPAAGKYSKAKTRASSEATKPVTRGIRAIILGIDPSLRGTGLAVIDTRSEPPRLLASRTVKLGPKLAAYECLGRIADAVEELAKAHGINEASICLLYTSDAADEGLGRVDRRIRLQQSKPQTPADQLDAAGCPVAANVE